MREGIVLYDKQGQEIWACANVDARSNDEVAQLISMNPALEKEIYAVSGQTYALGALPRILWVKNKRPQLYECVAKVSMFNDWLIYKLTGILKTEPSNGCTTGIFDLEKRAWDASILRKVGLKEDILPPVVECGEVVGQINAQGEEDTGLAKGTVVVAGGGDAQLGCVGVGVVDPNQAAVFGGSFWQYEYNTASARTDPLCRVRVNCHAVPGVWQYEALAFKPGLAMRWYRDVFCQEEMHLAKELDSDPYQLMNQQAQKVPAGSYGMMCAFSDVMNYIAWRHAAPTFTNFDFDPQKYNKYTFYRAILENTAMVTKGHLELVREATGNTPTEIIFAGGASKGDLWCQILADVLNLPVKVPVVKEATALGAAIMAGYGAGIYTDISKTARKLVKWDKSFIPNTDNHDVYEAMYASWRKIYAAQLSLADQGITNHMWAAPGL
jgi:autoinducer 2 (AI-2) kinase